MTMLAQFYIKKDFKIAENGLKLYDKNQFSI